MREEIAARLSADQAAVLGLDADTVIRAGAGAGKTTALVSALLVDLLDSGLPPSELAVCTFTRAAATELRSRVGARMLELDRHHGTDLDQLTIGTIDSLALQVIRRRGLLQGQDPLVEPSRSAQLVAASQEAANSALLELEPDQVSALQLIGIEPENFESLRLLDQLSEDLRLAGRQLSVPLVAEPDPGEALAALGDLLEDLTNAGQIEKVIKEIRALESRSWAEISATGWGVTRKDLVAKRDRAKEARDRYQQGLLDFEFAKRKEVFMLFWGRYQELLVEIKTRDGLASFADIMDRADALIAERPLFSRLYLDEAQDTSPSQRAFLRRMVSGPLISVADANQSIYAFRGADLDYFMRATADQDQLELTANYRSRPEILSAVDRLCRPGLGPSLLKMTSAGSQAELSGQVEILLSGQDKAVSAEKEAAALLPEALHRAREAGFSWGQIAVLLNTNHQIRACAAVCQQLEVPVQVRGSSGWLENEEIRDLRALLELLVDPDNDRALIRVLSSPLVGADGQQIEDLNRHRRRDDRRAPLINYRQYLSPASRAALEGLLNVDQQLPYSEHLYRAVNANRLDLALLSSDPSGNKWSQALEFISLLADLEREVGAISGPDLLQLVDQEARSDRRPTATANPEESVVLQTVHNAKGGQFPCVIVAGFSSPSNQKKTLMVDGNGYLGVNKKGTDSVAIEVLKRVEEIEAAERQRLLYVALTRAEDHLIVLFSGRRLASAPGNISFAGPLRELLPEQPERRGEINGVQYELIEGKRASFATERRAETELDDPIDLDYSAALSVAGRLSWSTLSAWRRCSLRRFLERDLSLGESDAQGSGTGARQFGIAVHRALELIINNQADPDEAIALSGRQAVRARKMVDQALEIVDGGQAEQRFTFALGPFQLSGKIDWIDQQSRTLIDWKTGDEQELSEDYAWQRKIYGLAALRQGPGRVEVRTVYLNGRQEPEVDVWTDLQQLEAELIEEIAAVLSAEPQAAAEQEQSFCAGCPGLNEICPVSTTRTTDS